MKFAEILKEKRGEALVEASVVWPVVIVLLIFTSVTVVYFAQCTIVQSQMHMALIVEEGKESETRSFSIDDKNFDFSKGICHGRNNISSKSHVKVKGFSKMNKEIQGTVHVFNEKRTIRYKDLFDEIV